MKLFWDVGSAYDFFVSLYVLQRPTDFGLRPSWAAGVRSRLPAAQRETLERTQAFLPVPFAFLHGLQAQPKNANAALSALAAVPPAERLPLLVLHPDQPLELTALLQEIAAQGAVTPTQAEALRAAYLRRGITLRPAAFNDLCMAWAAPAKFGEQYLDALQAYQQVFFAEEEARITSELQAGLEKAQALAESLPLADLLAELSRGVRFESLPDVPELILAPSYWSTPLVFYRQVSDHSLLMLFGCRPMDQTLVPGETVPAGMLLALRALDDATRLRILRYLAEQPQTPSGLAHRLRLRAPTVVHHLNTLRLAGLVEVTVQADGEKRYALRQGALKMALTELQVFLLHGKD